MLSGTFWEIGQLTKYKSHEQTMDLATGKGTDQM